jgi:hypothetical protein
MNKLITIVFIILGNTTITYAQNSNKDSLFLRKAIQNTIQVYYDNIGEQAAKYSGSQYPGYIVSFADGHPYFKVNALNKGTINYDGVLFTDVALLYDEVADCVVLQDSTHRIQLVNEKLKTFSILDDHFERIEKKENNKSNMSTGFYQLLAAGKVNLYKREAKHLLEKYSNNNELTILFEIATSYYIKKEGQFFEITNKKSLFNVLGDYSKDLVQFAKKEQLSFSNDKDLMLISVVNHYNKIAQ